MLEQLPFSLLLVVATTANREADQNFFNETKIQQNGMDVENPAARTNQSYIPAIPMTKNGVRVKSFFDRLYSTVNSTKFRFSFNPARCDNQLDHQVVLGFLDDWIPGLDLTVTMLKDRLVFQGGRLMNETKNEAIWHKAYVYKNQRFVGGKQYPFPHSQLYVSLTMSDAHFYVEVNKRTIRLFLFEENSRDVKFYQTLKTKKQARYFVLMASEYNSCPTFISMVNHQFPLWVQGLPNNTVSGFTVSSWKQGHSAVFDVVLWAVLAVTCFSVLVYLLVIPFINRRYPEGKAEQTAIHVINYGVKEQQQPTNTNQEETARSFRKLRKNRSMDKAMKGASLKKKRNLVMKRSMKNKKGERSRELLLKTQESEERVVKKKDLTEEATQLDHN